MDFWRATSTYLSANSGAFLAIALVVSAIAGGTAFVLLGRIRSVLRPLAKVPMDVKDPRAILPAVLMKLEETEERMNDLEGTLRSHLEESRSHLRRVGLVRYDAFEDVAGQQSFTMCLLDGGRNGVLLTYLTGKNSARSYAATIEDGKASRKLSDEENQALEQALTAEPVAASPVS
jgi:hypothetical protein